MYAWWITSPLSPRSRGAITNALPLRGLALVPSAGTCDRNVWELAPPSLGFLCEVGSRSFSSSSCSSGDAEIRYGGVEARVLLDASLPVPPRLASLLLPAACFIPLSRIFKAIAISSPSVPWRLPLQNSGLRIVLSAVGMGGALYPGPVSEFGRDAVWTGRSSSSLPLPPPSELDPPSCGFFA